jgi:protein-tyrosine phosphatase
MPETLDWHRAGERPAILDRALAVLARGGGVALPTETVYGVAASLHSPEALDRLSNTKDRDQAKPFTVAVRDEADALAWAPGMSFLARRLARRAWPGPMTLVVEVEQAASGKAASLPGLQQQRVCPQGWIGLRSPAHDLIQGLLARWEAGLALSSANRAGEPEAKTAQQVIAALGERVDLVIDDGPSPLGTASTVVRVHDDTWTILREGVFSSDDVEKLARQMIVFVCTGNTCRSPLAEVLFKRSLADRLQCSADQLASRGFVVCSAGLAAFPGGWAAEEAIEIARQMGTDLESHVTCSLTEGIVRDADRIVAMTQMHIRMLVERFPEAAPRIRSLHPEGLDIADPIGCDRSVYEVCAREIEKHVDALAAGVA